MEGLTIPKLFETHTSFPVNDLVLKTFDFAGLIESLGTGIKRMLTACKENGNPPPDFRQEGAMFVATLKKKAVARRKRTTLKTTQSTTQQTTQQVDLLDVIRSVLSGNTLRVALLVLQNPSVKIDEISADLELSRDGVNYHIRRLKQSVGLRREGAFQDSVWRFVLPKRLLRGTEK